MPDAFDEVISLRLISAAGKTIYESLTRGRLVWHINETLHLLPGTMLVIEPASRPSEWVCDEDGNIGLKVR